MPLLRYEIRTGVVAILDPARLCESDAISYSGLNQEFREGPFVCLLTNGEQSAWLSLTTRHGCGFQRLELKPEWKLDGSDLWRSKPQFVTDVRYAFVGPNRIFMFAGEKEYSYRIHKRPRISALGVEAILEEMDKYGMPRPQFPEPFSSRPPKYFPREGSVGGRQDFCVRGV